MSKTIVFFTCGGLNEPSGIGRYFPLAKELAKKGLIIHYLALHPDYPAAEKKNFVYQGVHIHYVGQMHVRKRGDNKYYFNPLQLAWVATTSTLKMIGVGLSIKADLLYCFKPQPINGLAALATKMFRRKPLLLDCDDYEAELNRLNSMQKRVFIYFEDKLMPRNAVKITYHSSFLKDRYVHLGIRTEKMICLPNGVERERFHDVDPLKIEAMKQAMRLEGKKIILYSGSLSLHSGHAIDLLIDAFKGIRQKVTNAVLILVGGGEDIDTLKSMIDGTIGESIVFAGRVDPGEVPCYIKMADVTVDPVRDVLVNKGRSPLKIYESLALGVPVVTSDIGDRREMIEENRAGLLVQPGSATALEEGIIKILTDQTLAEEKGRQGLKIIQKYYWDKLTEKLIEDLEL